MGDTNKNSRRKFLDKGLKLGIISAIGGFGISKITSKLNATNDNNLGEKMELILDFPTIGEPHYAAGIPADIVAKNSKKLYKLEENMHPYAAKNDDETRVERNGKEVHIYMTTIRSHFSPDNIEGIKLGDKVYFHVTNLEQDFDVPHGFAVLGQNSSELLVMPGQTKTSIWEPTKVGVWPFYCTDFCSALHQEMQGYIRVSPANANTPIKWSMGEDIE